MGLLIGLILLCSSIIPNGKVDMLLIGDSLSHHWTWADELELNHNYNITRRTKIGRRTDEGLKILEKEYKNAYPPHIVIVYLGVNDTWGARSVSEPIKNIEKMIQLANSNCGWVLIVSGVKTQNHNYSVYQSHLKKMLRYNVWITDIQSGRSYLMGDGVHLSRYGNQSIKTEVRKQLDNIVRQNPILSY